MVVHKTLVCFFAPEILEWVCPQDIAHQAVRWGLAEAVDLGREAVSIAWAESKMGEELVEAESRDGIIWV